jgi:hypothetical protein
VILVSDLADFKNSSLKSFGQMYRNFVGSIYGKSSVAIDHFVPASYQVSLHLAKRFQKRFLKIDQSETRIACGGHVC